MKTWGWNNAGRKAGAGRDILLIDEDARFGKNWRVSVEEFESTTIITARSELTAIDLLRTVEVDVIYNFKKTGKREDAERLRAHVSERYPRIRLMDRWTPSSRRDEENTSYMQPLFMRAGLDCDERRRMWLNGARVDNERLPELTHSPHPLPERG